MVLATGSPQSPKALAPPGKDEAEQKTSAGGWKGAVHGTYQAHAATLAATLTLLRGTYLYPFTDRPRLHQQPYGISSRITLFYG